MFHQPTECARNVRSATKRKKTIRNSCSPGAFRRERGAAVCLTQLLIARLSPSPPHVPNTWEVEAEKGRRWEKPIGTSQSFFPSLGNKIGIHYECFAD